MDFTISQDDQDLINAIIEFSQKKLNDNIFKDDQNSSFPEEKWKACGEFGLHGLPVPEEYGGCGLSMLQTALAIQALAYGCKDEGLVFSLCANLLTCTTSILHFGTEEQKQKYLPRFCTGELIGGNGSTEHDAGSDSSNMKTKVEKADGNFILNGAKIFVTNAPVADVLIIYAKHYGGIKAFDLSAFIVEKDNPGFSIGQVFEKMGLRTAKLSEVVLNNCTLPESSLLGRERWGMQIFNHSMLWERIIMGAYHIGAMEQQYDLALEYANTRKQFGKKIFDFSEVSGKLVEMKMRIETAKLMLYKVCWECDNGSTDLSKASMVKLLTGESKVKNSLDAVQIFGAYGYIKESDVEKQLRDSISAKIYSGTSEIQKLIISQNLGKSYEN